jgi:UDP-3-O-[3-hydroxymyristoyl] N-acetylglucosamine deacetylase
VHVDRPEMPGGDGSSYPFVQAIQSVGVQRQSVPRHYLRVSSTLRVEDEAGWVEAYPCDQFRLEYHLDYGPEGPIGQQSFLLDMDESSFCRELAAARTFLTEAEATEMRHLGLGGRVTPQDLLIFGPNGPIENELRYPDECVRHKTLDMLGDLALAGAPILGHFVAYRSGHRQNAHMVRALLAQVSEEANAPFPFRKSA